MSTIKGWENNKPTFIKGTPAENKFDNAVQPFGEFDLVCSAHTENGNYVLKVQEKTWELVDAVSGQQVHKDEKYGGYSHIASTVNKLFLMKAEK